MTQPAHSAQYLEAIADALPQLVWSGPRAGPGRFLNRRARAYVGTDPATQRWLDWIHEDDRPGFVDGLEAAARDAQELVSECRLRGTDGTHRWFRVSAAPFTHEEYGDEWVFNAIEIEDVRRRRDELNADRARLQGIIATSPGAIVSYRILADGSTHFDFISEAAQHIYGFTPAAILADSSLIVPRLDIESVTRASEGIARSLRDGTPWHADFLYHHPSGGDKWLEAHFVPTHDPRGGASWNGIVLDITERKHNEDELALVKAMLENALGATQMGAWVWDPFSNKVWSNDSQRALYQFTDDVPQWYDPALIRQRLHPDDVKRVEEVTAQTAASGERVEFEYRLSLPGGEIRWISSRMRATRDAQGKLLRVFGVNLDVTQQRLASDKALRSQKLAALGTLAGGIAHDFNNVLFAINGNATLALDVLGGESSARHFLDEIVKASSRATELVGQILAFSRPQDQKLSVLEPVGPVREAVKLVRATLPARIAIACEFDADTPVVLADAARLVQVVINLCTNAAHAIGRERGGTVAVRLSRLSTRVETSEGDERVPAGTYALLSVTDDGSGMDESTRLRIFDPFFTTKLPGEGSGLGLSVVHGIVRALGGYISVQSRVGVGSTFRLLFPAGAGSAAVGTLRENLLPRGRGERVLYVDDEPALVALGRGLLEVLGYTPDAHRDAHEALHAFRANPRAFAAVVTDLSMPGMSGFELARAMLDVRPELPILVMSGNVGPEERVRAKLAGVREIALKPVSLRDLAELLARMVKA